MSDLVVSPFGDPTPPPSPPTAPPSQPPPAPITDASATAKSPVPAESNVPEPVGEDLAVNSDPVDELECDGIDKAQTTGAEDNDMTEPQQTKENDDVAMDGDEPTQPAQRGVADGSPNVEYSEEEYEGYSSEEAIAPTPSRPSSKRARSASPVTPAAKRIKSEPTAVGPRVTEGTKKEAGIKKESKGASSAGDLMVLDPADEYPRVINPSRESLKGRRPLYRWGSDVVPAYKVLREVWNKKREQQQKDMDAKRLALELEHRKWVDEHGPNAKKKTKKPPAPPTDVNYEPVHRWWVRANSLAPGEELPVASWPYFEHKGLIFTPHYEAHEKPLLVRGKEVVLHAEAEEICNFWCGAITSDYAGKKVFQDNFWEAFTNALGKDHMLLDKEQWDGEAVGFEDLDFSVIHQFLVDRKAAQVEANKALLPEVKLMEKDKKEELNLEFGRAIIGGLREKLQQFRTEPPSLFRPRGKHPKMGWLKRRTFPEQVSINVSQAAPVPLLDPTYLMGHSWGEVYHKDDVTWLAFYRDNVMQQYKYMYLASSSGTKGVSDFKKYEKARKLQYKIDDIRRRYEVFMRDGDTKDKQIGLAVYLIDRLALRAGNDKEEDEADTVGCCSLRKEHLTMLDERNEEGKRQVYFDFLGKDSIPYQATVPLDDLPFKVMKQLLKDRKPQDQLFNDIDPTILNKQLQEWAGFTVSAKVFRTYNASITLQQELAKMDPATTDPVDITCLKAFYDFCNREVAVLCNHQRAAPKTFDATLGKMRQKLKHIDDDIEELKAWIEWYNKDDGTEFNWESQIPDDPGVPPRKTSIPAHPKIAVVERRLEMKLKLKADKDVELETKEANRTVATGTSRMHYMDPRITVAFCKKRLLPIQKVFQKTLVNKFPWAMNVPADFVW